MPRNVRKSPGKSTVRKSPGKSPGKSTVRKSPQKFFFTLCTNQNQTLTLEIQK